MLLWMKHEQKEIRLAEMIEEYKKSFDESLSINIVVRDNWTSSRESRGVQHKATKVDTVETSLQGEERLEVLSKTKATMSETETSQQWAERLEVLSKTKQYLSSKSNVEHFDEDYSVTDNTATVHQNT